MRQTVKNRMIKNVQMMAVGMMATASIMGTAAAMGVKMDNIPFNVLANPFQAVMTQGVAAIELGSSGSCGDNATYELSMDGTLTISGTGAIANKGEFVYNTNIKKVIINEGITEIADQLFSGSSNLESISLPQSLEIIGSLQFKDCISLKEIIIPPNVKEIKTMQFYGCSALSKVTLNEGLEEIGNQAFKQCYSITEITIPDSVKTIRAFAFGSDNQLTNIHGLNGVTLIEQYGFWADWEGIQPMNPTYLYTNNEYALSYNWLGDQRTIVKDNPSCGPDATYEEDDGKLTITGQGSIDDEAFKDKDTVTEVVIEEGITEIGNQSFENMDNLETVIIPDSVTNIGDQAFAEDPKLEIVQGGDNADIADNAFDCTEPETTIKTDNENIYNNIKDNTDRDVQLQNSVPISPVEENWLYSSDDEAFITDKVQVGSVKDDFESLLDDFATVVGLDEKQGAKQNYETADASNEDTLVYCTKASDWIITIPKDLVMSGDDESRAEYVVGIYGNVDPAKRVTVTPAPSFEMTNTGNAEVKYNAQVNQTVTGINGMDIIESPEADVDDASQMSGTITANLKRAGSYRGTMTFTVDYVDHT